MMEKLILMTFKAPWCAPCKAMEPIIKNIVSDINYIDLVEVNVDEDPDMAREYGIRSIPTLILKRGNEVVNRLTGGANPEQVRRFLLER